MGFTPACTAKVYFQFNQKECTHMFVETVSSSYLRVNWLLVYIKLLAIFCDVCTFSVTESVCEAVFKSCLCCFKYCQINGLKHQSIFS